MDAKQAEKQAAKASKTEGTAYVVWVPDQGRDVYSKAQMALYASLVFVESVFVAGVKENLLTHAAPVYRVQAVSQSEWDYEVACALRSLKADDMLNELVEVEEFINAAVANDRPDLIGAIYMAARRAMAERIAFDLIYGKPMQGNDAKTVVANLLLAMKVQ